MSTQAVIQNFSWMREMDIAIILIYWFHCSWSLKSYKLSGRGSRFSLYSCYVRKWGKGRGASLIWWLRGWVLIWETALRVSAYSMKYGIHIIKPLHPNIRMHILHTVLYTFPKVLTRRIFLSIKSFFSWWSFTLFLWPYFLIQGWYCIEKLEADHS